MNNYDQPLLGNLGACDGHNTVESPLCRLFWLDTMIVWVACLCVMAAAGMAQNVIIDGQQAVHFEHKYYIPVRASENVHTFSGKAAQDMSLIKQLSFAGR